MERQKKIVFLIWNMSHCGGTERVLSVIANGLSLRGYQVFILSREGHGKPFFPLDNRVNLYWLDESEDPWGSMRWIFYSIKRLFRMGTFIRREKPDVLVDVDIINGFFSFFVKNLVTDLKWISWEHFSYFYRFGKADKLRTIIRRLVSVSADQLVVLTDRDKRDYQKHLQMKCGITRIYNPLPYETEFIKKIETPIILAVGRLVNSKGFDLLICSWKLLEEKYPGWTVVIAGEGEERERLQNQIRQYDVKNILFVGNVYPIEKYYEKAAFLVLPSRNEAFGMVLIEAMHFSLPVVSYAGKAGPREIITDQKDGFLVEPGDVEGFAKKMEILIEDETIRRKMGRAAQKKSRQFEKEKILNQWESLLEL